MNILYDKLPEAIEIDGNVYDINTDFRPCLRIITAYEDPELTATEKHAVMLQLLYKDIPDNLPEAVRLGIKFLNCGEEEIKPTYEKRTFSFKKDAQYIYTAINQTHGIDLESIPYLHFWKFCYMFSDIGENTLFSRMVYLRNQHNKGKLTKEERKVYDSMRDLLELPTVLTADEIKAQNEFLKLYNNGR